MYRYKVIRIFNVVAKDNAEALEKIRTEGPKYMTAEIVKELEENGWLKTLSKQVTGK